jgi:hypothetical protein
MMYGNDGRLLTHTPTCTHTRQPSSTTTTTTDAPNTGTDTPVPVPVPYSAFNAYGASKLANLLTALHLDRQRAPPTDSIMGPDNTLGAASPPWDPSSQHFCVYACTPGMVHTRALFFVVFFYLFQGCVDEGRGSALCFRSVVSID